MRLDNVELENFRAIGSAKLELQGKSTVIFGINGTGKSSILRAINLLYAFPPFEASADSSQKPSILSLNSGQDTEIKVIIKSLFYHGTDKKLRFWIEGFDRLRHKVCAGVAQNL